MQTSRSVFMQHLEFLNNQTRILREAGAQQRELSSMLFRQQMDSIRRNTPRSAK